MLSQSGVFQGENRLSAISIFRQSVCAGLSIGAAGHVFDGTRARFLSAVVRSCGSRLRQFGKKQSISSVATPRDSDCGLIRRRIGVSAGGLVANVHGRMGRKIFWQIFRVRKLIFLMGLSRGVESFWRTQPTAASAPANGINKDAASKAKQLLAHTPKERVVTD